MGLLKSFLHTTVMSGFCLAIFASSPAQAHSTPSYQFLEGFAFAWDFTPHRFRQMQVILAPQDRTASEKASLGLIGGTWSTGEEGSDKIHYQLQFNRLETSHLQVIPGQSGLIELYGQNPEGPKEMIAQNIQTIRLDKKRLGISPQAPVTVVLQGFEIDTAKTHPMGYTLRELRLGIEDIQVTETEIRFQAVARLRAGSTLDRPVDAQSLQRYGASAQIYYAIVSGKDLSFTPYQLKHQATLPGGTYPHSPPPAKEARTISLPPISPESLSWPTLQSFHLHLNPEKTGSAGRYLRAFGVLTEQYQPSSTGSQLTLYPHFSNAGLVSFATTIAFETQGQILKIPTSQGQVFPHRFQGTMATGHRNLP